MANELINKVEEIFYNYARKYDENIKKLMKQRNVEISGEELDEILQDAKNLVK